MKPSTPTLPEVMECVVSLDDLHVLLGEIRRSAIDISARTRCDVRDLSLDDVPSHLTKVDAHPVQLRYSYDGAQWIDTLTPHLGGVRILRIRHESLPEVVR